MESRHDHIWRAVCALSVLAAVATWALVHRSAAAGAPAPRAAAGPLPLTPAAAAAALGYPAALDDASRFLCLTGKKVALLGDSQMFHLNNHLVAMLGGCELEKLGSRCGDLEYMRLGPDDGPKEWQRAAAEGSEGGGAVPGTPPPADDEGPVGYGLVNLGRGCRDCQGCDARLNVCRDPTGAYPAAVAEVEYLAVEFSKDVSLRCANHSTTQQAVAAYLASRGVEYVVFNTGLHDTALRDSSAATYGRNLRAYTDLLRRRLPGAQLLWMATAAVRRDAQPPEYQEVTSNAKIHGFNAVAAAVMAAAGVPVLDPFPLSQLPHFQALNTDGVHFWGGGAVYYDFMAWDVLRTLCGAARAGGGGGGALASAGGLGLRRKEVGGSG